MIIDVSRFQLRQGVDEPAFLAADQSVQIRSVPNLPGFVRRTTAKDDDGWWLIVMLWGSEMERRAAEVALAEDADALALNALLDVSSVRREVYETLD